MQVSSSTVFSSLFNCVSLIRCEAGYYQDEAGATACKSCLAGYYCEVGQTASTTNECEEGYYCTGGNSQAT